MHSISCRAFPSNQIIPEWFPDRQPHVGSLSSTNRCGVGWMGTWRLFWRWTLEYLYLNYLHSVIHWVPSTILLNISTMIFFHDWHLKRRGRVLFSDVLLISYAPVIVNAFSLGDINTSIICWSRCCWHVTLAPPNPPCVKLGMPIISGSATSHVFGWYGVRLSTINAIEVPHFVVVSHGLEPRMECILTPCYVLTMATNPNQPSKLSTVDVGHLSHPPRNRLLGLTMSVAGELAS